MLDGIFIGACVVILMAIGSAGVQYCGTGAVYMPVLFERMMFEMAAVFLTMLVIRYWDKKELQ